MAVTTRFWIDGLNKARQRWLATGRDPGLFDGAVNVLHGATTNTDILKALARSVYTVRHIGDPSGADSDVWMMTAEHDPVLAYERHETRFGDADVAVLPDIPGGMVAKTSMP
jgi:hypothetical protein